MSLAIIDSGGANLSSVQLAFARLGVDAHLTKDPQVIRAAERVVLPGVGSIHACMQVLNEANLASTIRTLTQPVLGICVGLQMLAESSEEGADLGTPEAGLGIISGRIQRLRAERVPHMGWAQVASNGHPLFEGLQSAWFYFVHSYAMTADSAAVIATSDHQGHFAAAVAQNNFVAVQFHPERSASAGARLLENFLQWTA